MTLPIPSVPIISLISTSGFVVVVNPIDTGANPPSTCYSFRLTSGGINYYVTNEGALQTGVSYLNVTSLTVVGATPGTVYTVSLSAATDINGDGQTSYGASVITTTNPILVIPSTYSVVTSTTVVANWVTSNGNGTSYDVQLSTDPTFSTGVIDSGWTISYPNTAYVFKDLEPNTLYYGQVRAQNNLSVTTGFVSLSSVVTTVGPSTVTSIQVINLLVSRGFLIRWAPNPETNLVQYNVYRSSSPSDLSAYSLIGSVPTNVTSYFDNVPYTFGLVYYYIITALDDGGKESSLAQTDPSNDNSYHSFVEQPFPNVIQNTNLIYNEVPSGTFNGVNTLFTTSQPYRPGTLQVFLNRTPQIENVDYTEGPLSQQFTFTTAPIPMVPPSGYLVVNYVTYS